MSYNCLTFLFEFIDDYFVFTISTWNVLIFKILAYEHTNGNAGTLSVQSVFSLVLPW